MVSTGGHHHLLRFQLPFAGEQAVAAAVLREPLYGHTLMHISAHVLSKSTQVGHDFGFGHESLRLIAVVREIRQLALPVGCHQAEGIPALLIPGMADSVLFEHQGADAVLLKCLAHRETGLSSPDHHHLVCIRLMLTFGHASAHNWSSQSFTKNVLIYVVKGTFKPSEVPAVGAVFGCIWNIFRRSQGAR